MYLFQFGNGCACQIERKALIHAIGMLEYEAKKSGGIFSAVSTSPSTDTPPTPGSGSGGDGGAPASGTTGNNSGTPTQDKPSRDASGSAEA